MVVGGINRNICYKLTRAKWKLKILHGVPPAVNVGGLTLSYNYNYVINAHGT